LNGFLKVAVRNLGRNRRRNLATGIAIAIGFAAFLALGGYANRVNNMLRVQTVYLSRSGHITIYKSGGLDKFSTDPPKYGITADEQQKIEAILRQTPEVEFFGGQLQGVGLIGNGCRSVPFVATGLDPGLDKKLRAHPQLARWLPNVAGPKKGEGIWNQPEDIHGIAVSEGISRFLNKSQVYSEIPKTDGKLALPDCMSPDVKTQLAADSNVQLVATTWEGFPAFKDAEIVSIYNTGVSETNNVAILTSLKFLQSLYETDRLTTMTLWLKPGSSLSDVFARLRKQIADAGIDAELHRWDEEEISPFYVGTIQFLFTLIFFLGGILATIIAFSIFNAATMTVIERTQEIGMMRAMGFSQFHIRRLFVLEVLSLCGTAMALGGVVGGVFIALINQTKIHLSPPGVSGGLYLLIEPDIVTIFIGGVLTLVVAVTTTLIAVRRTVRGNIPILLMGTHR
jgi:putative ABC transport system permease protein